MGIYAYSIWEHMVEASFQLYFRWWNFLSPRRLARLYAYMIKLKILEGFLKT